ncbi:hypothetical protein FNF29_06965 [Cafeteria roenbergensis]|uniref:glucan 1,3-beta-glucosidase n=1 Tax=Cafeteria roenbergensis TaxID=33653 RepID=A0A5A8C840_CAFRO|nr:hypothetical protein FNF29_06965 [Cafeteria roenbergensis]|eukprot:KAA0148021.1 hypothetical protein FNF29_06965 [Cafeteria roenbergensis]
MPRISLAFAAALACAAAVSAAGPASLDADGVYRGVNLGGWLVLESWLSPSVFAKHGVAAGAGEWQFCEKVGRDQCGPALQEHWDTWLTEAHIATLAEAGLQYARIPLGYWIVDRNSTEPLPAGGWWYLERAVGWLKSHGMRAVLDLHGAPGSQNGHDNSGRTGDIQWPRPGNVNRTVAVLAEIARRVVAWDASGNASMAGAVAGIEVLNEPWTPAVGGPVTYDLLRDFYVRAYDAVREQGFNGTIWVSDGFAGSGPWVGVLAPPQYTDVLLDSHLYHAFGGPTTNMTAWDTVRFVCDQDGPGVAGRTDADWVVVGEWSNAVTKRNPPGGRLQGGAASWLRAMLVAQLGAWDGSFAGGPGRGAGPGKGSFFWNFRTETGEAGWDLLMLLDQAGAPPQLSTAALSEFEFSC